MLPDWSPKALWLDFMSLLSTRSCRPMSLSAALYSLSPITPIRVLMPSLLFGMIFPPS